MLGGKWTVGRAAAAIYVPFSIFAALLFVSLAWVRGGYPEVAVYGGGVWVFVLSMIVSMPLVTAAVKRRLQG